MVGETKLNVPRGSLPKKAKEGDWPKVEIADGKAEGEDGEAAERAFFTLMKAFKP